MSAANPTPTPINPDDPGQAMQAILQAQRDAFHRELPVEIGARADRLDRGIDLLTRHQDELTAAMSEDFGHRPELLSKFVDVVSSVNAMKHAKAHLKKWMRRERRKVRFPLNLLGARAWLEFQPLGVIGIISPWNFPVNLTFSPLASALAAGNRCMIKPSEYTPKTAEVMRQLVDEYFSAEEVWVVTGGREVGQAFSQLAFDHLLFTGSTEVGRHIMRAAADNLTPVTLELGGKSPAILGRDVDLQRAARRIVIGKMMNAGQVCLAPDYVLVPEGRRDAFVAAMRTSAEALYPTAHGNEDYTMIVDQRQADRLAGYLRELDGSDTEILPLQDLGDDASDRRMPLTLVIDPPEDVALMREEIFGPILPVKSYGTIDEAIDYVNSRSRPLALYYFGDDTEERDRVLGRTISGGVTLDDVVFHVAVEDLPFGGIGASGIGAYHGQDGFRRFSHAKAVFKQPKLDVTGLIGAVPPYGDRLKRLMDWDLR
ncbi:MAG: coniferyl aldehyde dehydrogenase [Xanthomonadales bacterium]|nr:coniferyl aldehyde dehydrogenase [Xanthomonadales bacterium]